MVRRTLVATLLGGLLLLGAPTVAYAGRGGNHPTGNMGNGGHMGNRMGSPGMHHGDGRFDRRFDRDDRRFDRDDRRFRHRHFFFVYAPYYYPYYYPCSYSYYYRPYSYGYPYPPGYCPPSYGYDYGYGGQYDSAYGAGTSGQYGGPNDGDYGASPSTQ